MTEMTIPVQIDSVTSSIETDKVRCVYYRVETVGDSDTWPHSMTGDTDSNMAVWSDWAILTGPDPSIDSGGRFNSPESIDGTIERLEKSEKQFLDLAHIWVPAMLFDAVSDTTARNGDVYRISLPLFRVCYSFISEHLTEKEWLKKCKKLSDGLKPSLEETDAFRSWRKQEVERARKRYHEKSYVKYRLGKKKGDRK